MALSEASSRRACSAILSGLVSWPAAAAANSSASGMEAITVYESREAIA